MEISVHRDFSGMATFENLRVLGHQPRVFLNGRLESKDVIAASEEKGYVVKWVRNEQGNVHTRQGVAVYSRHYGQVKIEAPVIHESCATLGGGGSAHTLGGILRF